MTLQLVLAILLAALILLGTAALIRDWAGERSAARRRARPHPLDEAGNRERLDRIGLIGDTPAVAPSRLAVSASTLRPVSVQRRRRQPNRGDPRSRLRRDTALVLLVGSSLALILVAFSGFGQVPREAVLEATGTPGSVLVDASASTGSPDSSPSQGAGAAASANPLSSASPSPSAPASPAAAPTPAPTPAPTAHPTAAPTARPTSRPTSTPRSSPSSVPTNPPPVIATFTADRTSGQAPLTVHFSASYSGGDHWILDYGDGTAAAGTISPVSGIHAYAEAGSWHATLTVSSALGTKTTRTVTITVTPPASPSPSPS